MLINVNTELKGLDGTPIKERDEILNFGDIALVSLNANFEDEKIEFKEKTNRFVLMTKIYNSKESFKPLEITVEEASLLKKLIGKLWIPLIVGRCIEIIENKEFNAAPKDVQLTDHTVKDVEVKPD